MPVGIAIGVAGAAGAGASIYGANKASKAAGNAADKNAQVQREQYQQTRSDLAPYNNAGYTATNALMQRFGLAQGPAAAPASGQPQPATSPSGPALGVGSANPSSGVQKWNLPPELVNYGGKPNPSGQTVGQSLATFGGGGLQPATIPAQPDTGGNASAPTSYAAPATSGGVDYAQVLRDRPDVMAEYQKVAAVADRNSPQYQKLGLDQGPEGFAAYWYNNMRNPADYTVAAPAAQTPAPASATPAPPIPGQTLTSADNGGLGPRSFTEQQPTYGPAPNQAQYLDQSNFAASPGYQFRMDQGIRNLNAGYGAKGLLKSGAAMQGINDYAQGQASSEYNNWFNQQFQKYTADTAQYNQDRNVGLNQFNTNRGVYDQNFNTDRGYNTDQYNTYTGNLFNLANMGQSAAAGTAAAGQNYAAGMTANNNSLASVQGNAAIAGANGVNSAINSGMQAYGMSQNPFSVSAGGYGTQGYGAPSSFNGLY